MKINLHFAIIKREIVHLEVFILALIWKTHFHLMTLLLISWENRSNSHASTSKTANLPTSKATFIFWFSYCSWRWTVIQVLPLVQRRPIPQWILSPQTYSPTSAIVPSVSCVINFSLFTSHQKSNFLNLTAIPSTALFPASFLSKISPHETHLSSVNNFFSIPLWTYHSQVFVL